MSRPSHTFRDFLAELKRRRVFRVAAAYVVVAFALLQAADIIFPALGLPPRTMTLVVALAFLGFPAAVVLAWAFGITPEGVGIFAAPEQDRDPELRRLREGAERPLVTLRRGARVIESPSGR